MVTISLVGIGLLGVIALIMAMITLRRIHAAHEVLQSLQADVTNKLNVLHGEINSRLSQLLQSTQQASELVGRAAERADRLTEERNAEQRANAVEAQRRRE